MQDLQKQLRVIATQVNPTGAAQMPQGCSAVLDPALRRSDQFDIEAQMGIRREDPGPEGQFMGPFFSKLNELKAGLGKVQESMDRIRVLKQLTIQATTPEQEKSVSQELTFLLDNSNKEVLHLKKALDALKQDNVAFAAKNPNSSEGRIRENLVSAIARRFREIIKEYQAVQTDYKKGVKEKVLRQVRLVFPDANEDETSRMVEENDMSSLMAIRMRIDGRTHEGLVNALSDIQDKYRDIRRLEQSVSELHQMFVDLATLVDAQEEMLNQIEFSVNSAKDYTEKAEKELIITRKHQQKMKKRMCWVGVCIAILAIAVMVPVIIVLTR